jgi:hypothetical protein
MREYEVHYKSNYHGGEGKVYVFASDRADAIHFVEGQYRGAKAKSARLVNRKKVSHPEPSILYTAEAGVDKLMTEAEAQVKANAHSGRAIGRFLRLKLSYALTDKELRRACEWIVRQVEQKDATSEVIKK